jgi:hypothetical protein
MKLLCCNKHLLLLLFFTLSLFGNIQDKSAIVYYGKDISYPMVGIHDYIIVEPNNIDTTKHGFAVYKNKMYAYVSIGEIDPNDPAYKKLDKKLIVGKNNAWKSKLLDLTNPEYKKFLFADMIAPQIKKGFKNFFFDTLDSYQLIAKTPQERAKSEAALVDIIHTFHQRYPNAKLILNRGFEIIDQVHNDINAVLFESYYHGVGGKDLAYIPVSDTDRQWLDKQLKKVSNYGLDIICVDYLPLEQLIHKPTTLLNKLQNKGFIPYVATKELDSYGYSSKNPIKREILTLINEKLHDRVESSAHLNGALPIEYLGYIEKLYDVNSHPLPTMRQMQQYGGVIVWMNTPYKEPSKLIEWVKKLRKYNIKVVFAADFCVPSLNILKPLGIVQKDVRAGDHISYKVIKQDSMMGFEIAPPHNPNTYYLDITEGKALYELEDSNKETTTLAAIMPWGGYAISSAFMIEMSKDNLWTINPFKFFAQALRLKPIPILDTTTQNGRRILFSHIDGDGIMNRVEWDPDLFSGDTIYSDILTQYKVPISVSVIGAEINKNGLYPKLAPQLQKIVKKMFALPNVEPATHTFTHPFFWNKIINGNLSPKYRLKPKGYKFSLDYEIKGMLDEINERFLPKNKYPKAKTIFWSGDCVPPVNILRYVYKHHFLNLNGGDTYISNLHPWLSYVAPMGLGRDGFYQIYTGEQNENIYTNEWLGPFWGFKKVIQTFKLTNKPRRLKPIDIYYHQYSGSKRASINALKYVYNYAIKQSVNPIFASEYIPKVMDYYTASMAANGENYFIAGLNDIKTIRIANNRQEAVLNSNIAGYNTFNKNSYLHIGDKKNLYLSLEKKTTAKEPYLVSSNGKILSMKRENRDLSLNLKAHIALEFDLFVPKGCHYTLTEGAKITSQHNHILSVKYKNKKGAHLDVRCRL